MIAKKQSQQPQAQTNNRTPHHKTNKQIKHKHTNTNLAEYPFWNQFQFFHSKMMVKKPQAQTDKNKQTQKHKPCKVVPVLESISTLSFKKDCKETEPTTSSTKQGGAVKKPIMFIKFE
jgi:hypothetical protein